MDRFITKTPREDPPRRKYPTPRPGLPDPNRETTQREAEKCAAVKPLHAGWVIEAWNQVRDNAECLITGWRKAGIIDALRNAPIDLIV